MLIINADDYGINSTTTDKIIDVFKKDRITSASAMVFTEDAQRAAKAALEFGWDIGLHLNFTNIFTRKNMNNTLIQNQNMVVKYFTKSKYHRILYNPKLQKNIEYCFNAQYDEFQRLYQKLPSHIDGHHHIHLCSNIVFGSIIPKDMKIRTNLSYRKGEANLFGVVYRKLQDIYISKKYKCTDNLYSIALKNRILENRLKEIVRNANLRNIEIVVHPGIQNQYEFLLSPEYYNVFNKIPMGSYNDL